MLFHDEARAPLSKFGLYGLVTVLVGLIALGVGVASRDAGRQAGRVAARVALEQIARGCDRNQVQRAYLRIRARDRSRESADRRGLADSYFRTVNCKATYASDAQAPVFLGAKDDACFVRLTRHGEWARREPVTDPVKLRAICR